MGTPKQPPQEQAQQPGLETEMTPKPHAEDPGYRGSGKLEGKVALITGGDSGIGRAVAIAFAKEGADSVLVYLSEHEDANETKRLVEEKGRRALLIAGDIGGEQFCQECINKTVAEFGKLDILINNAAEQHPKDNLSEVSREQVEKTFRTNVFAMFDLTRFALPELERNQGVVINTTSVTAYRGSPHLLDYSSTKGAIVSFTRALSKNLAQKKIRVNAVAPGPIWTPLIPATFPADHVEKFGSDVPLGRAGQPDEVAPSYVFLASNDSSYMTGQVLHPNGGEVING